jgi:hypothetical protein
MDAFDAAVTLGAVLLGAAISEVRTILDDGRQARRSAAQEVKAQRLDEVNQTRRRLSALVDQSQALMVGNIADANKAVEIGAANQDGSLYFVGDDAVAREYVELLVLLNNRAGLGIRVEDRIRSVEVLGRVAKALGEQALLARQGKPLRELSAQTITSLSNTEKLTARLVAFYQPPSVNARLSRLLIDRVRWRPRRPK